MAFFLKKKKKERKNLKQSKHTKRKNQRVALLQIIIYYRNSAATQLFWLQPWWAESGRKAVKRGTFYALLTEEPRTRRLWEMVCLVLVWEFSVTTWSTNCLKLISLSSHFPLQSFYPLVHKLQTTPYPPTYTHTFVGLLFLFSLSFQWLMNWTHSKPRVPNHSV